MTRRTYLTPLQTGRTVSLSNGSNGLPVFRKRILPLGEIRHPETGERVRFDRAYHQSLIDSFNRGATEQMPLQLANDRNQHNMNPELTRAVALRLSHQQAGDTDGPGLYADFQPISRKAAKLLQRNPGLGVSCQITEDRQRVDGKRFPRVLRHVLATLDPRVVGLGAWRSVSLSDDTAGEVIDLTASKVRELSVGKGAGKGKGAALELSDAEAEAAVAEVLAGMSLAEPDADEKGMKRSKKGKKALKGLKPGNAARMAQLRGMRGKGKGGKKSKTATSLSDVSEATLDLAAELDESRRETAGIRAELAASRWKTERRELARVGVPKPLLDLAEPVLISADAPVLSLSNEDGDPEEVDVAQLVRDMLAAVPRLDLSDPAGEAEEPDGDGGGESWADKAWEQRSGPAA